MNSAAPATVPAMSVDHHKMATAIRFLAMDAVEAAKSGHPGLPMGMADVATVLFTQFLKFDASAPHWADRDRFILSGGHGSALIYALGYLTGYEKMTIDEVRRFRQLGSLTPGHPEHDPEIGVETTTGPLGQGIANAVGFALAERILAARFGDDLVDHYTYVMCGDGDLMEGISHEAASLAGHLGLSKLIVLYDDNGISIDGSTALSFTEDTQTRFQAYGWATDAVDGHNPAEVADAIRRAQGSDRPTLIACKTVIGYGAPTKAGTHGVHGSPLGEVEIAGARAKLGWAHEPFVIPDDILNLWREAGRRGADARRGWEGRLSGHDRRREFETAMSGGLPAELPALIEEIKRKAVEAKPSVATRVASGQILEALLPAIPELVGGSADLTPSNNTKAKVSSVIDRSNYGGRYVHWGVREHGMAAALNGLALHGGLIPYAGTFMQFTDYCRPAIRLSALMHQRVVFVMTHDSIGLGEDGPTHQPVEHLAALRAIPNLLVLRPADLVETAECWQIALESTKAPSVLALTRQNLVTARETHTAENLSAKGGYVLREATGGARKATILATGSEVEIALKAREALEAAGIPTAVVSLPCFALFDRQPEGYRKAVLGTAPRVAIEAGVGFGWERYTGDGGAFVGMTGFGASAPYQELYKHFGITADAVVEAVKSRVQA